MIRIVHVSDLHLAAPGATVLPGDEQTLLQRLTDYLLKENGICLNVKHHDQERLAALNLVLDDLNPDIVAVTGDLTTYGDRESMKWAAGVLRTWSAKYKKVVCVPGNHDALQERLAHLRSLGNLQSNIATYLGKFVKSFEDLLQNVPNTQPVEGGAPVLLENYHAEVDKEFGSTDPSHPHWIETSWGGIYIFLFNSVNDPGWMANAGRIGARQFNQFNLALNSKEYLYRKVHSLRVALCHHHPLPIPYLADSAGEKFYDDMLDGSTFCYYLNKRDFHVVLHGHKHRPYTCRIQYEGQGSLNVLAAGTATQSSEEHENASFNVIDVVSPFQSILRRYEYHMSGFAENEGIKKTLEMKPLSAIHFTSGTAEVLADQDLRNLLMINPAAYESEHDLELIDWKVKVDKEDVYHGVYRLKGKCRKDNVTGLRQVITGSPNQTWNELKLRAWRTDDPKWAILCDKIQDHPRQKCFSLRHPTAAQAGDCFDYTYEFRWKNEPADEMYFDAINLFNYGNVGRVEYLVTFPWQPMTATVETWGLAQETVKLPKQCQALDPVPEGFQYKVSIDTPKQLLYVIRLPKQR